MRKGQKFSAKRKIVKKKRKTDKFETINKKAIFNRYKNVQKVEEEWKKKNLLEQQIAKTQVHYSESEEEENAYMQLVSCFRKVKHSVLSDSEDDNDDSENENVDMSKQQRETFNEDADDDSESLQESEPDSITDVADEDEALQVKNLFTEKDSLDDPFTKHYQFDLADELVVSLSNAIPEAEHSVCSWPAIGNFNVIIPKPVQSVLQKMVKQKVTLLEEKLYAPPGSVPCLIKKVDFDQLFIKSQIQGNIVSANKNNLIKRDLDLIEKFTSLQKEIFSIINNYQDLYYPERTFTNAEEIRYIYCLHAINHMLKSRTKILHHNSKITKNPDLSEDYRDQGLVRPKILIMVPFRDAAYRVVNTIKEILVPKGSGQVLNKKRFEDDFTGGEIMMPRKNPKPEDYELLFSGNTDDTFRFGMTVTKKSLKLYTEFYSSDIIVASPLGLRMIVGAEGEEDRDYDFLASIEVLIMDQADVFMMQNWEHLLHVLDHFHLQPKKMHGTDFSRIRSWAANGWSKYYRQTLLFSSVSLPEMKCIINKKSHNYAGKVMIEPSYDFGTIQQVLLQVPQIFYRFEAANIVESVEARFQYFIKEILPNYRDTLLSHTLIYVPSYFDFVRLRNYFKKEDISFVQICEYSKDAKIARARDMFYHTEAHFMLYSERAHFFRRFRIKGIRHIIFYQPPTYPNFYQEMCNLMQEWNQNKFGGSACNMSVSVVVCALDAHRAAALLGRRRLARALAPAAPRAVSFLTARPQSHPTPNHTANTFR